MFKFRLTGVMIIASLAAASVAYAELFSFQTNTTTQTTQPQKPGQTTPPLSANDFKNKVATDSKQAQQELFKQTQTRLKDQSNQMPLPNTAPKAPQQNQLQSTAPTTTSESATSTSSKLPIPTMEEVANSKAAEATTATTTTTTTTSAPPPVAPAPPTSSSTTPVTTAPSQGQVYTGFGGGSSGTTNTSTTTAPASNSSGGGWNVKY